MTLLIALLTSALAVAEDNPNVAPFDEFQSEPRHVALRIDPVAPLLDTNAFMKRWGVSIDVSVGQAFTIGPSLRGGPTFKIGNSYSYARLLGVTGGYYLNGNSLTTGFVVWPSWYFASLKTTHQEAPEVVTGELDAKEASVLAGFQWFFDGNFNLNVGLGLKYRINTKNVTIANSGGFPFTSELEDKISFASEIMIGWAF